MRSVYMVMHAAVDFAQGWSCFVRCCQPNLKSKEEDVNNTLQQCKYDTVFCVHTRLISFSKLRAQSTQKIKSAQTLCRFIGKKTG